MEIEHGVDNGCGDYNKRQWFKCGACHRKCCWCFGGDSELESFQDICNDCWAYAMAQAKVRCDQNRALWLVDERARLVESIDKVNEEILARAQYDEDTAET